MSASLNQADLPGREFMCVNDASVCKCLTQITMIPALILVCWAAVSLSPAVLFHWLLVLYISAFPLKNAKYALRVHVWLCCTGPQTDQECDLMCF